MKRNVLKNDSCCTFCILFNSNDEVLRCCAIYIKLLSYVIYNLRIKLPVSELI